ncbi:oxygenase MpaB family protein, partial [Acinetobacter baumannii]
IAAYLDRMRPQLLVTERTHEVVRLVMLMPVANPLLVPAVRLMADAGIALLPDWVRRELGLAGASVSALRRPLSLAGMRVLAP